MMTLLPEVVDRVAAASGRAGLEQPVPVLAAGQQLVTPGPAACDTITNCTRACGAT